MPLGILKEKAPSSTPARIRKSAPDEKLGNNADTSGTHDFEAGKHEEVSGGIFGGEIHLSVSNLCFK